MFEVIGAGVDECEEVYGSSAEFMFICGGDVKVSAEAAMVDSDGT